MGWLGVIFGVVAAVAAYASGHTTLSLVSVVAVAATIYADRVCYRHAIGAAQMRPDYTGKFTEQDMEDVPTAWASASLLMVALCLILAAVALAKAI